MTLLKVAVDPGFGNFKIAWLDDHGQIQTRVIPSIVGIGQVRDLAMLGLGRQRKQARPLQINWDDIAYLIGENVHRHAPPIEDLDYRRLSEGTVNQGLYYAALGSAFSANGNSPSPWGRGGQGVRVALMIGLPVEITLDRDQARAAMRSLRRWLIGYHGFSIDGQSIELEITQLKGAGQPVGAYLDWGMNTTGEWIRELDGLKLPIGVCDIGFNTVDLFSIENGDIVDRETAGNDLGMHRVAHIVRDYIYSRHQVDLSLQQADALVRDYLRHGRARFFCADGEIDLTAVINQGLEQIYIDIRKFIKPRWGTGRQFYTLIFAGGGGQAYRRQFLRDYPAAYLPGDLLTTNVRGLLKRAQRIFKD